MSKVLSLKLRDDVFVETEAIVKKQRRRRNAYINEAVAFYNRLWKRRLLGRTLARESATVAAESMAVLAEFEAFEEEPAGGMSGWRTSSPHMGLSRERCGPSSWFRPTCSTRNGAGEGPYSGGIPTARTLCP